MYKLIPYNTTLYYMKREGEDLIIAFKKLREVQERKYRNVPIKVVYGLFNLTTAKESLKYYADHIKGKYEVLSVKNISNL